MNFMDWIKEHKALAIGGGFVLFVIIYVALRGSSSSTSASYIPVATGPSDAVQESEIAASVQQAQLNSAASQSANQLQAQYNLGVMQLQSNDQTNLLGAQVAQLQSTQAEDVSLAGLSEQQNVSDTGVNAQVAVATEADQTQTAINQQNQSTQQLQISSQATTAQEQLQTEASMYNTGAQLQASLAGTAAGVINNQTNATLQTNLGEIGLANNENTDNTNLETTAVNDQTNLNSQYLGLLGQETSAEQATQASEFGTVAGIVASGDLNKGGEGGANQIAALQSLLTGASPNPYPTATASVAGGNSTGGIISSIGNLFGTIGKGIAGGLNG